jgi:hypothetical protein
MAAVGGSTVSCEEVMVTWTQLPTLWNGFQQWTPHGDDREFADGVVFFSMPDKKWRVNNLPKLGANDSAEDAKAAYETWLAEQTGLLSG